MKSLIKMLLQIARRADYIGLYLICRLCYPIEKKRVLFLSDSRREMSGNFAFIFEEIKESYSTRIILGKENRKKLSKFQYCKELAKAEFILVDDFYPIIYPIPLRKQTELIQVWHAVGAFKTVGFARRGNKDRFSMTHRNYTGAIVSSEGIRKDYAKAFRMEQKNVYPVGIPRTDVFFDEAYASAICEKWYQKYPILREKKVILFAPTFRGDNIHQAYYDYEQIDFQELEQALSDEYVCVIKMHPFVKNHCTESFKSDFFLDLTEEREVNDLLFVTDVLVTDYSSIIFEASLLEIQTIFFAYDLEEYTKSRDFFYPYDRYAFGPVVKDQQALLAALKHPQMDEEKKKQFQSYFMGGCDGHATKRFVDTVLRRSNS